LTLSSADNVQPKVDVRLQGPRRGYLAIPSPPIKGGTFTTVKGRYEHNLDVIPGDSGAAAYDNGDDRSNGIQSTQWSSSNPARVWNEVRKWDATTHNFFDAYGNWPRV
jgi:hypothetical protein